MWEVDHIAGNSLNQLPDRMQCLLKISNKNLLSQNIKTK